MFLSPPPSPTAAPFLYSLFTPAPRRHDHPLPRFTPLISVPHSAFFLYSDSSLMACRQVDDGHWKFRESRWIKGLHGDISLPRRESHNEWKYLSAPKRLDDRSFSIINSAWVIEPHNWIAFRRLWLHWIFIVFSAHAQNFELSQNAEGYHRMSAHRELERLCLHFLCMENKMTAVSRGRISWNPRSPPVAWLERSQIGFADIVYAPAPVWAAGRTTKYTKQNLKRSRRTVATG